jgi:uncharacterized protein
VVRPKKNRAVEFLPDVTYFKPRGVPMSLLEERQLAVDELEAIRLKDLEDLDQEEAAKRMEVSRATFQRVLESARRKVAEALVKGMAIRVEGGHYSFPQGNRLFKCEACGHQWEVPFGTGQRGIDMACIACASREVHRIDHGGHGGGRQPWGWHGDGCKEDEQEDTE